MLPQKPLNFLYFNIVSCSKLEKVTFKKTIIPQKVKMLEASDLAQLTAIQEMNMKQIISLGTLEKKKKVLFS